MAILKHSFHMTLSDPNNGAGQTGHSPFPDEDRGAVVLRLTKATWFYRDSGPRNLPVNRITGRFTV